MSERAEMECKRCGDNEDRIDGFCSKECKDKYSLEEALSKMSIRIDELEAWINKFIAEGEYLSLLNGIVPGDSNFDKLVEGYFEERER